MLEGAVCLLWTGKQCSFGRVLGLAALIWLAYAILIVCVGGVILDQDLVPAQVISGYVHYPPGHPHEVYYSRVFNLPSFILAGLWNLIPSPLLLSALRNIGFVFLSVFVPFALTTVITRRPSWGYFAAAFTVCETAVQFHGVYPVMVFPDFNSDGHVGAHMALLTMVLLMAGLRKIGGFSLGLLPAIHPTMAVIAWPWSVCYLWFQKSEMEPQERRRLLIWVGIGLSVCIVLACIIFIAVPKTSAQGPYDIQGDGSAIYQRFEGTSDFHRRPLAVVSLAYLVHPLAVFLFLALLARTPYEGSARKHIPWLVLLCGIIWTYVCIGTAIFHQATGWLPLFVQISMPGRFSNLSALMLIPLCVAMIARVRQAPVLLTGLLITEVLLIPINYEFLKHYFMFIVWGAALAADFYLHRQESRGLLFPGLCAALIGGSLAFLYVARQETAIFAFCASWLGCVALLSVRPLRLPAWSGPISVALMLLISLGIPSGAAWATGKSEQRSAYYLQPYDLRLIAWLSSNAPNEPLLASMGPLSELQAKTGHPVLMELETLYLMTYMPSLAPVIGSMARDLYGVDYAANSQLSNVLVRGRVIPGSPPLMNVWRSRSSSDWRQLGQKYRFRLVLSPTSVALHLAPVVPGPAWTLYSIE